MPSNIPPTRPSLARNSSMIAAFQSFTLLLQSLIRRSDPRSVLVLLEGLSQPALMMPWSRDNPKPDPPMLPAVTTDRLAKSPVGVPRTRIVRARVWRTGSCTAVPEALCVTVADP